MVLITSLMLDNVPPPASTVVLSTSSVQHILCEADKPATVRFMCMRTLRALWWSQASWTHCERRHLLATHLAPTQTCRVAIDDKFTSWTPTPCLSSCRPCTRLSDVSSLAATNISLLSTRAPLYSTANSAFPRGRCGFSAASCRGGRSGCSDTSCIYS